MSGDFGIDFQFVNVVDAYGNTTIDIDESVVLDGDPRVAQIADLNCLFEYPGDLDFLPETTTGSGVLQARGVQMSKAKVLHAQTKIDNDSLSDERIASSQTVVQLSPSGDLNVFHQIITVSSETFVTNVIIGDKQLTAILSGG